MRPTVLDQPLRVSYSSSNLDMTRSQGITATANDSDRVTLDSTDTPLAAMQGHRLAPHQIMFLATQVATQAAIPRLI